MKILTIYYKNSGGGCFARLIRMIDACLHRGWSVHYLSGAEFQGKTQAVFHKTPKLNHILTAFYYLTILPLRICMLQQKEKFDRFIAFGFAYGFIFTLPSRLFRVPSIIMIRGNWLKELEAAGRSKLVIGITRLLQTIAARSATEIIVNSVSLKNDIAQQIPADCHDKMQILPNDAPNLNDATISAIKAGREGILREYGITEDRPFIVGYSGTLKPIKEVDILITAFSQLKETNCYLIIIGSGPLADYLRRLAAKLQIYNKVIFTGWKEDPLPYIACLNLMVHPTKSEGCPNSILEALACNVPCIASNVTGVKDILNNPATLFEPSNSDALAMRLNQIISSEQNLAEVQNACAASLSKFIFDWDARLLELVEKKEY